jgi:hypothetical protein
VWCSPMQNPVLCYCNCVHVGFFVKHKRSWQPSNMHWTLWVLNPGPPAC